MALEDLGYNPELESYQKENKLDAFEVGRVISEHKERYIVRTPDKEYEGEIIGNLRYTASSRNDFPAVGDWVAISKYDEQNALIHAVFPRKTIIERQAVGKFGEKQIIAANIDYAFIVQAVDRDFNINRIERYLTICNISGVEPIILLTKVDLIAEKELSVIISNVRKRIKQIQLIPISNLSHKGLDTVKKSITHGKTYCLLGSSGVGKSTLLNNLSGKQIMKTNSISSTSNRGRHITSHRELFVLDNGGILIDNPGMREVGMTNNSDGLNITFDAIVELSTNCKFKDCSHTTEIGCAVIKALEDGNLNQSSYDNYLKIKREQMFFESSLAERRKKDKDFGKMLKNFKKSSK